MTIEIFILCLVLAIPLSILIDKAQKQKEAEKKEKIAQLERYTEVSIGMPENEMLSIMRDGYSKSCLNKHKNKYVWRINAESHNSGNSRVYEPAKKVIIHTNKGFVVSINPYNV